MSGIKDRIEISQLLELSEKEHKALRDWWTPSFGDIAIDRREIAVVIGDKEERPSESEYGYNPEKSQSEAYYNLCDRGDHSHYLCYKEDLTPLLAVGQMCAFLESRLPTLHIDKHLKAGMLKTDDYEVFQQGAGSHRGDCLRDSLWKAVKASLCKNK